MLSKVAGNITLSTNVLCGTLMRFLKIIIPCTGCRTADTISHKDIIHTGQSVIKTSQDKLYIDSTSHANVHDNLVDLKIELCQSVSILV